MAKTAPTRASKGRPKVRITEAVRALVIIDLANGVSNSEIAKRHQIGVTQVGRIAKAMPDGYKDKRKSAAALKARVADKAAKLELDIRDLDLDCEQQTEAAIERAALTRAEVVIRHKDEWNTHATLINGVVGDAVEVADFAKSARTAPDTVDERRKELYAEVAGGLKDRAQVAKMTAETIAKRQEMERKLYGIDDSSGKDDRPLRDMSTEDLEAKILDRLSRMRADGFADDLFEKLSNERPTAH